MAFRGPAAMAKGTGYAGVAGADLANAPSGPVPFTSPYGLPITRMRTWYAGGNEPGAATGGVPGVPSQRASGNPDVMTNPVYTEQLPYGGSTGRGYSQFGMPRPLQQGLSLIHI